MSQEEKEELKQKNKLHNSQTKQGRHQSFNAILFETQNLPQIIMLNRGRYFVEGFMKLSKHIFKFEILLFEENDKIELRMKIKTNRSVLERREIIEIKQKDYGLDLYLAETRQYILSVYS